MLKAVSLFASGGIADLALEANGVHVIVANEIVADRASLYAHNFPDTKVLCGDIWDVKEELISNARQRLSGTELDIVLATPPCQGMSKNGQGKILQSVRSGKRPKIDPRNRLIIPTLEVVRALQPRIVIFENVPEMLHTIIDDERGRLVNIIQYIKEALEPEYFGHAEVVEFADHGVPQRRKRLITIFTRDEDLKSLFIQNGTFIPNRTHSQEARGTEKRWVSVRDVIGHLPALDGKDEERAASAIPFHSVPVLDPKKYTWISHTPPEKGAFDNQCVNKDCLFTGNPIHGSQVNKDGINRPSETTPLYCIQCGSLLPRPYVADATRGLRLMAGYTSAYKRMRWDLPAPTLTTNLQYPSSDHKIHPEQNRVLSLYEAFKLHTLDQFQYEWIHESGERAKTTLITEVIGESIPPKGIEAILRNILSGYRGTAMSSPRLYRLKNSV
ncbi:MAG TPA: DNA cytosine methyltransferase [Candidatus Paceibacterota bacterium]|nr:DNA cytosine methyltransferase [Candidatus Paceibacterota bacterium]